MKLPSKVKKALNEFVEACKDKFGRDLISVVLFGSRVKGYAREDSDFDVLVVVKNLPDVKKRFDLVEDIEDRIWNKYKIKISSILLEPEEIFEPVNPLLFGVLLGYKVLFGQRNWKNYLGYVKEWVEALNPVYVEGGREWNIKRLIKS